MKKATKIIVLSLLAFVFISFVFYGQIKANEAQKNEKIAIKAQMEATKAAEMARHQAEDAAAQARMAEARTLSLAEQLQECQSK